MCPAVNFGSAIQSLAPFLPQTSDLYARVGVGLTVESAGRAYVQFAGDVGLREATRWFRSEDPEAQGTHPALVRIFNKEAQRWSQNLEPAYGMTVRFEGLDLLNRIPAGAMVMCAAVHHASLEPCYTPWKELPQIRPVPEAGNYLKSSFARKSGLGALLAGAGFVFVDRTSRDQNYFSNVFLPRLQSSMQDHGLWPLIFVTAGRPPVAYHDNGSIARPGLFSKAQGRPEEYLDLGIITTAFMIARKTKQTVHIPLIVTEGEHLVKPKAAKNAPFVEPVTRGQTVTHRIVGVMEMTSKTPIGKAKKEMVGRFKEATGIEGYLTEIVSEWGKKHDRASAAAQFADQASREERLLIIADRTRSIPLRLTPLDLGRDIPGIDGLFPMASLLGYRNATQKGVLDLLANPDPERLGATLGAVTTLVGAAEYRRW